VDLSADPPQPDSDDPGLIAADDLSLLVDQYELAMCAGYLKRDLNQRAVFEHFARRLPQNREWLLAAGLGPTLELIAGLRFDDEQLAYVTSLGFDPSFVDYLRDFRFGGDIDAMPEGTIVFANEPLVRVTAPRIEAQLLETVILNQINFQTMIATKAARVVLAAGGGEVGHGDSVIDFSARRDHGAEASMKVARSAAIAGCGGTSNVAAAMRYGLRPVGTMAHSYVLSFPSEPEAFEAFVRDNPDNAVLLVDTYETLDGVANAIEAARSTGVALRAIRRDSGDLAMLSREARRLLDAAGMAETQIFASGDLNEDRIAELIAADAPIDAWGVGTDLGTSRDSPVVNGVYKLVADELAAGGWRGVEKRSPGKETHAGAKQVFRRADGVTFAEDVIVPDGHEAEGTPLLIPVMRGGEIVHRDSLEEIRKRAREQLAALPEGLRARREGTEAYPVRYAEPA
jgi:nicotinate phosphoribosyltransferase